MGDFIIRLGLMGLQASFVIIVIFAIRFIFNMVHIPRKYITFLWIIPFFFLVFPWKITSPAGFWNKAPARYNIEKLEQEIDRSRQKAETKKGQDIQKAKEEKEQNAMAVSGADKKTWNINSKETRIIFLEILWGTGAVFLFLYSFVSYLVLKRKTLCSINSSDNIYYADNIQVPMVLGYIKPGIYIPSGTSGKYAGYAVEHEKTHIRRKDFITKPVLYFIVCLHWFNPLVWIAYSFMAKDMEMACDEETLQRIGLENKKEYAAALLNLSIGKRNIFAAPCAFGEGNIKKRVENILHYKKTVKIVSVTAVLAGILIVAFFITEKENNVLQGKTNTKMLTFEMVKDIFEEEAVNKTDFHNYTNGEEKYSGNGINCDIDFYFKYIDERYRLRVSYSGDKDIPKNIYITSLSDNNSMCIYEVQVGVGIYQNNLEEFLKRRTKIHEWLDIELPEPYSISTCQPDIGFGGGFYILPESYYLSGEAAEYTPKEWRMSGSVGKISNSREDFLFIDGKINEGSAIPHHNHSIAEEVSVLDCTGEWQVLMALWDFDLYTAGDSIKTAEESISRYWYFYFVKENELEAYYLALSEKEFTREEAVKIAETVKIK